MQSDMPPMEVGSFITLLLKMCALHAQFKEN